MKIKLFSKLSARPKTRHRIYTGLVLALAVSLGAGLWFNIHTSADSLQRTVANNKDSCHRSWEARAGARTTSPGGLCPKQAIGYKKSSKLFYDGCWAFGNITLNSADTITTTYITLKADLAQGSDHAVNTSFHLWDADNVTLDGTECYTYSESTSANLTANSTSWVLGTGDVWADGDNVNTPNFNAALAEVVARGGWSSGNNIAVVAYDSLSSVGNEPRGFKGPATYAPVLNVTYTSVVPEFTPWTLALTVAASVIVIFVVRRYVFAPKKVKS